MQQNRTRVIPPLLCFALAAACLLITSSVLLAYPVVTFPAVTSDLDDLHLLAEDGRSSTGKVPPDALWRSYASALTSIRCFISPGCFHSLKCRSGVPKKVRRGKRWEERSFCVDDLRDGSPASAANVSDGNDTAAADSGEETCLIYSVGLFNNWNFESEAARLFGCHVHAFDPTMDKPSGTILAPGVTFHKLGLQGVGTNMSATHGADYRPILPELLLTLEEVMTRLGHQDRKIDLLVMDCEGCEWGVLRQMACTSASRRVAQLSVEFHFQKSLGLHDESDVLVAAEAVQCLEREGWGITAIEASGAGRPDWQYARGMAGVVHNAQFLGYISLRRLDEGAGERAAADFIEDYAAESIKWHWAKKRLSREHGEDRTKWSNEVKKELNSVHRPEVFGKYNKIFDLGRIKFDEHPHMEDEGLKV